MHAETFSSLRTIATVRAVGRGTFTTTPVVVNVVSSAAYANLMARFRLRACSARRRACNFPSRRAVHMSVLTADLYQTNLFNKYFSQGVPSPYTCASSQVRCSDSSGSLLVNSAPVFYESNINLSNARLQVQNQNFSVIANQNFTGGGISVRKRRADPARQWFAGRNRRQRPRAGDLSVQSHDEILKTRSRRCHAE